MCAGKTGIIPHQLLAWICGGGGVGGGWEGDTSTRFILPLKNLSLAADQAHHRRFWNEDKSQAAQE